MRTALRTLLAVAAALLVAYLVLPRLWRHYEHQPALEESPRVTLTAAGAPGDPLNVGLVGTREEMEGTFYMLHWPAPAAPASGAEGAPGDGPGASPDELLLFGRGADLEFAQAVAPGATEFRHVRFWRDDSLGNGTRPFWIGAATRDSGNGTARIAPDIDAEREHLMQALISARHLEQRYQVTGVGPTLEGRSGGDRYFTDGELDVGVLIELQGARRKPPEELPNPERIRFKNWVWGHMLPLLRR